MLYTSFISPPPLNHKQINTWQSLHGSSLSLALSHYVRDNSECFFIALPSSSIKKTLLDELRFFLRNDEHVSILEFTGWECLPYDNFSPHTDIISERMRILHSLLRHNEKERLVIVSDFQNLLQRLPPKSYVSGNTFQYQKNQTFKLGSIKKQLTEANYSLVNQVMVPSEFAVRGGIVDVFPMGSDRPFRIDLLDDTIDSIRFFNPETQITQEQTNSISLLPVREFPMNQAGIKNFRSQFRKEFSGDPQKQKIYKEVSQGNIPAGTEFFFPLFFEKTETIFDYLPKNTTLIHPEDLENQCDIEWDVIKKRYQEISSSYERQALEPSWLYLSKETLKENLSLYTRVIPTQKIAKPTWDAKLKQSFNISPKHNENPYQTLINYVSDNNHRIVLILEARSMQEKIETMLEKHNITFKRHNSLEDFILDDNCKLSVLIAPVGDGFFAKQQKIEVITETQIFGSKIKQRQVVATAKNYRSIIRSLADVNVGDPVVHADYGVGRYQGLVQLDVDGDENEYLLLEYAEEGKLYVPALSLNLISRYLGGDPKTAPIHHLGKQKKWIKQKEKASKKAYDVGAELVETAAKRETNNATPLHIDEESYSIFCQKCGFAETPDQMRAIDEVQHDLQQTKPMDRLICGDVGFGKTEVALRASFIASHQNGQVAILTPTTLLAKQHYNSFVSRFYSLPVKIALLSGEMTIDEKHKIKQELAQGKIQIVIGTHALVQKDIRFDNLTLLIVDEEHHFGVRDKERIKQMRTNIHILTLTATPIPRTLNLAMAGMRDISIIATPPENRLAIKTFVRTWDKSLIREACLREIRRGGQVYFINHNIRTMPSLSQELMKIIPEASIEIAHGQMPKGNLSAVMHRFYHQKINILLCTTIVESGLDIPTANTIIINRADHFGLAQLHQLRGRVGRSHNQAYAYLICPSEENITKDASRRLEAISAMDQLGSGFELASHDLEIRGAGELLGEGQSGTINEIGFNLYSQYLEQAIQYFQNNVENKDVKSYLSMDLACEIHLHETALFPDTYLSSPHMRLEFYRRLAEAKEENQIEDIYMEMIDRFGLMPIEGKRLFAITKLRHNVSLHKVKKIDIHQTGGDIQFYDDAKIDPINIIQLIQSEPQKYRLTKNNNLKIKMKLIKFDDRVKLVTNIMKSLTQIKKP